MATAARLALAAWRNELCTRTIRIVGMDLTAAAAAATLRAQIRSYANQPGDPKIDLTTVAAGSEGISFGGVTTDDSGATVSTLTLQIDKATMSDAAALPYSGEAGDDNRLVWQLQIDGITRAYGDFIALASAIDSDMAPTTYTTGSGARSTARPWDVSTLTFSDDSVTIVVDGVDIVAGLADQVQAAADTILPQKNFPLIQLANVAGTDTITADAPDYVTAYQNNQIFLLAAVGTNTGAATLQLGDLGALPITDEAGAAIAAGDLQSGQFYALRVSGSADSFRIIQRGVTPRKLLTDTALLGNPTAPTQVEGTNSTRIASTEFVQRELLKSVRTLSGVAGTNTITATAPVGMSAYSAGQNFLIQKTNADNSGPVTLNIGGLGALPVLDGAGNAIDAGDLRQFDYYMLRVVSNAGSLEFRIVSPSPLPKETVATVLDSVSQNYPDAKFTNVIAREPNLFTADEIDASGDLRIGTENPTSTTAAVEAAVLDGVPCWKITVAAGATSEGGAWIGPFPRSKFGDATTIASAFDVLKLDDYAGPNSGQNARAILRQYDASGTQVANLQITIASSNAGVDSPETIAFPPPAIAATMANAWLYIACTNTNGTSDRSIYIANPLIAPGANTLFRRPPESSGGIVTGVANLISFAALPSDVSNACTPPSTGTGAGEPVTGFTSTGLDLAHNGLWVVANVGQENAQVDTSTYVWQPSLVFVSPDGRTKVNEILLGPIFSGIRSVQGVATGAGADYWFADLHHNKFQHVSYAGADLGDGFAPGYSPNSCAYDKDNDYLIAAEPGTTNIHWYDCADGSLVRTDTGGDPDIDQLNYDESTKVLVWTKGENGADGTATFYDTVSKVVTNVVTLPGSRSMEGGYFDPVLKRFYSINDAAFHVTSGTPPVSSLNIYELAL